MALTSRSATTTIPTLLHHHFHRTFLQARIKWVRDPYLDTTVEKEKNLKQILSLKSLILSQPSQTLPLSTASAYKHPFDLPSTAINFFQKYPSIFQIFHPKKPLSLPHVKLTHQATVTHHEEMKVLKDLGYRVNLAERVAKVLMLCKRKKVPFFVLERLRYDLGLPHDFVLSFLPDFPEYFQISEMGCKDDNGCEVLGLELVSWRSDLAVSVLEERAMEERESGMPIKYSMNLPRGFDLEKRVRIWVNDWQNLPYISPYEDAFFLAPNSDQAEKWTVGVLHELLHLMISKKTEKENLLCLGEYLGFGTRFKKALVHHPGIFYVSNKIRTQTAVLRESYKKDMLVERCPLMGMRYRYIHLMNKQVRAKRPSQRQNRIQVDGLNTNVLGMKNYGEGR